jgi:hypothetical protein
VSREIVELSLRYGILSRETSFVAVERRETPVVGDMQLRRIPIALTTGVGRTRERGSPDRFDAVRRRCSHVGAIRVLV